jgi:hypothetical protein
MTTTFDDANNSFFEDFMKCISTEEEQEQPLENSNICLITNEPLSKFAIRLNCGHSFNYGPLLNAIYQYKLDQNKNGGTHSMDTHCPYCREKTKGLLPYAPNFNKIKDVNIPFNRTFGSNSCKHMMTKKQECGRTCYFEKCHLHIDKHDIIQCNGITKAGTPCKNKATSVENYCKLHRK